MSGFRRSPLRRFQLWFHQRLVGLGRWLNPRWLSQRMHAIRRGLYRAQIGFRRLLAPRWLTNAFASLHDRLRRAESSVARKREQVSQTVARSAVGEGAKKLARGGRLLEFRLSVFFIEGAKFLGTILGGLVPGPLRRMLGRITWQLGQLLNVVLVFVGRWIRTRHYWHLLGGLPAFLLALPLAYCMIRMPFYTTDRKAKHYRRAAEEALLDKDYTTADLYYRKLYQLGAMNDMVEFQAAISSIESGDETEGLERLRTLAPEDQPGFAPAHLWMARWYLEGKSTLERDAAAALAEKHLEFALDREPGNIEARALRARHMQLAGRWDDAATELQQVVKQIPEEGLSLAEVYARQGRWDAARREVDKVLKIFDDKLAAQHELNAYEYSTWCFAYQIIGDLPRAETVLKAGCEKYPDDSQLRDQLHGLLIGLASSKWQQRQGEPQAVVDRLLLAAQLKPDDLDPLVMLGNMTIEPGGFGQAARQSVYQLLDGDQAPPKLYAIVGPLVGLHDELPRAIRYLQKAVELNSNDSYSLNNLAFCLLTQGTERDAEALALVERALVIEPQQAMYRETRGQLLVRLGRYQEGIDDLTFALNEMGDQRSIHAALATAYEQLGQPEQARLHREHVR